MRTLAYSAAMAIVVASGLIHGFRTARWSSTSGVTPGVAALDRVPMTVAGWQGQPLELDRRTMAAAGIDGYLMRRYTDRRGVAVTALLVCGKPGPISVHTPEVCYAGNGFEAAAPKVRVPVGAEPTGGDQLWAIDFDRQGTTLTEHLRVLYAWCAGGSWAAVDRPRFEFAGAPFLYKLYLVRDLARPGEPVEADPGVEFAGRFLPELRRALFPAP